MKQDFCDFPLEIKLIVYNYFDPKDKIVLIDELIGRKIFIESKQQIFPPIEFYNYKIYFWGSPLKIESYTIEHFLWRKSQIDKCLEKMKQYEK